MMDKQKKTEIIVGTLHSQNQLEKLMTIMCSLTVAAEDAGLSEVAETLQNAYETMQNANGFIKKAYRQEMEKE